MVRKIKTPLTPDVIKELKAGDSVELTGIIYTGRDAAHKRLCELVAEGGELPFPAEGAVIYFVGPTPARPGQAIGSAGPTTSYRMDAYSPTLMRLGLRGMIGKGRRSAEVIECMKDTGSVYFGAIGGAGALISQSIKSSKVIAYDDLGPEAIRELYVEDMPLTVVIDSEGTNLYETGPEEYLKSVKKA